MSVYSDRHSMRQYRQRQPAVQVVLGLAIATLGVLFTLDNLHIIRARDFLQFWPFVFVAIGLLQIAQARNSARVWSGAIWIGIGGVMLANRIGLLHVNLWTLWPLLLVFVGARIFWRAFNARGQQDPLALTDPALTDTAPTVTVTAILGGFERKITSAALQRAELTAFMGGGKLDLRDAVMAPGGAVIDVFSVMGGFEIIVPDSWPVDIEVTPFMGGCDDKTMPHPGGTGPRLVIRGFVMMGGLDIKNR
jgi:predicted membrane protein